MAVAGLHKASGLDSYLGENHSSTSRSWCNNETRTSSIRKMWQDLESDNRAGEKGRQQMSAVLTGPESPCSSSMEGESMKSEDTSIDANEIENECPPHQNQNRIVPQNRLEDGPDKERVRKNFHECGTKSFGGHSTYSPCMNTCSRAQWVGENECKRVRLVREWIELSTQQGDICRSGSEEPVTKIGSRIEPVGDGNVDCGAGARSSIRRIYGKQALLDLLNKFERERDKEVEGLLEKRLVSNFAHRHRIQSLLKGRFLRNQRFIEVGKQTSVAASELGFLRQTHAVSEIRKGFLFRLNNYEHVPEAAQSDSDTSSDNDTKYEHTEQVEEIIGEQFETTNLACNWKSINSQECASPVAAERHDAHRDYDSDASSDNDMKYEQAEEIVHDMPTGNGGEFETTNLTEDWESQNLVELASLLTVGEAHHDYDSDTSSDHDMQYVQQAEEVHDMPNGNDEESETTNLTIDWESQNLLEFTSPLTVGETHESILEFEERDRLPLTVEFTETISPDSVEGNHSIYDIDLSQGTLDTAHVEQLEIHKPSLHLHALQTSTNNFNWQQVSTQADELHEDDDGGGGWYQETLRSDFQESHEEWYDNLVGDSTETWMGGNSYLEAALVSRNNEYYSSGDNDNSSCRFELRELTSRRTVSNLLQSDFGARLEQLLQSYVDRQDQAFEAENGWILEQEQQQQQEEENAGGIEDVDSTQGVPIPDFHHQHLATNREIINGLRIDMNTLQQRMNDMQKMLEACMDMQLALQQSVHQEIYPALNGSANSRAGGSEDGMWNYQSKSSPENGVCFICCDDGFESLTHRSADMYICSKCAQKVNWSKLKESVRQPQDEVYS